MARFTAPNGLEIIGSYERVSATVGICDIDMKTGEPTYDGSGSKMDWDNQAQVKNYAGKPMFIDEDGTAWPFDVLTRHEEADAQVEDHLYGSTEDA